LFKILFRIGKKGNTKPIRGGERKRGKRTGVKVWDKGFGEGESQDATQMGKRGTHLIGEATKREQVLKKERRAWDTIEGGMKNEEVVIVTIFTIRDYEQKKSGIKVSLVGEEGGKVGGKVVGEKCGKGRVWGGERIRTLRLGRFQAEPTP